MERFDGSTILCDHRLRTHCPNNHCLNMSAEKMQSQKIVFQQFFSRNYSAPKLSLVINCFLRSLQNLHICFFFLSCFITLVIILMVTIMKTISPSGCRSGGQIATWQRKAPLTMGTTKQPNVSQFFSCAFHIFTFYPFQYFW